MAESSTKPYLIRAIYEWCNDNGFTPYLAVAVDERTQVPREYVKGGEIVLNVSPMATARLSLGNDLISFQARFGGVARELSIPVENVSAVYARENGHGMAFDVPKSPAVPTSSDDPGGSAAGGPRSAPLASVPDLGAPPVPVGDAGADRSPGPAGEEGGTPVDGDGGPPEGGGPRGRRPRLTRIK